MLSTRGGLDISRLMVTVPALREQAVDLLRRVIGDSPHADEWIALVMSHQVIDPRSVALTKRCYQGLAINAPDKCEIKLRDKQGTFLKLPKERGKISLQDVKVMEGTGPVVLEVHEASKRDRSEELCPQLVRNLAVVDLIYEDIPTKDL